MRFSELNWMDVEKYLQHEDRVIVVIGTCEQHGYLSLMTDIKIPMALADAASQKTGVLIAPEMNFGISPYFLTYPGTISLRSETLLAVLEDIVRSLYGHGFRKICVLNGHGGNMLMGDALVHLANQLEGLQTVCYSWWLSHGVEQMARNYGLAPEHANWLEAFPFTRVCDLPASEKPPVAVKGQLNAQETRAAYGDGSFGGKYQVAPEIMDEMFQICLNDVLHLLSF